MKAMILAAGYGTRLKPLTNHRPKALVEIKGIPLIEIVIKRLIKFGFNDIIINLHHFANQLENFIRANQSFGINIQFSDESEKLLDTGGGILKAKWFFDKEPFLIYNVDILSDIDIKQLIDFHYKYNPLVTLALSNRATSRKLLFDENNQLCEWRNNSTGEKKISRIPVGKTKLLAYSGIHIIDPQLFDLIEENGVFSIMDVYLRLAQNHSIIGFEHKKKNWYDMGKYTQLIEFNLFNDLDFLS
jgi:NDP-sugar pyrophosphorylase family protein